MKKSLLELTIAYKKNFQTILDTAKKKLKNLDIKTSERLKYIKESDDSRLKNY